jgi:hypothetical protein
VSAWLGDFLFALITPPVMSWCAGRVSRRGTGFINLWLAGCCGGALAVALVHGWAFVSGGAVSAAVAILVWWWRRHRDKFRRLAGAIGEKARQRRAALVRTMRQRSRPRPVLRPVPGGAR